MSRPTNDQIGTQAKGGVIVKKLIAALVAAICAAGVAAPARAQYPDRPIKMIVPWAAGGDTDNIFRPLAPVLQKHLGQTIVIANVGWYGRCARGQEFAAGRLHRLCRARLHPPRALRRADRHHLQGL